MSYLNRNSSRKSGASAELLYLVVVLAAGAGTFWYAGHKIGLDLSSISTAATILGIGQTAIAYNPRAPVQAAPVQQTVTNESQQRAAAYCEAGQAPAFTNGMAALKQQLGETMGTPVECEHAAATVGDTVQSTTTGLAAYTGITNTVTFTDGWHHWALRPAGDLVSWEGTQAEPPTQVTAQAPTG